MAKSTNPKSVRERLICIFCQGASGTRITKEHVFGLWLKRFFPRNEETKHVAISIEWPDEIGTQAEVDTRTPNQGHVGSINIKVLCRKCNNEKFSDLETRAKSALGPLIEGKRSNILPGGQKLLATWAAKTTMIAEYLKPVEMGILQTDRTWLLKKMHPPITNWFVWIAGYSGENWRELAIYQSRLALSPEPVAHPSEAPFYAHATTFVVGHILFCVVSSSSPSINRFAGYETENLLQIWPPQDRSILWPPLESLNDEGADSVANIFKHSGIFDQSFDPGQNWEYKL